MLAVGVAVLSGVGEMPRAVVCSLVLVFVLLVAAVGAALLALRPVVPKTGLDSELVGEVTPLRGVTVVSGRRIERRLETRRLHVLARLADRKLRSVRIAVDLVLSALLVAGMGLLSGFIFN